ncbi:MAG: beta family protein [Desulfovibrio sp.]|nr:beta family protein [Desulfovibrio sp.]MBI4960421.1 beta family protein [Desulfovibrio sp.]
MFDFCHYVPIVKTKKGELVGVENLQSQISNVTPLWEVFGDFDDNDNLSQQALNKLANKIRRAWQRDEPCFVDASNMQEITITTGVHPAEVLFNELHLCGVRAIPVISPGSPIQYQQAIRNEVVKRGEGLCFRLFLDYEDEEQSANQDIDELLEFFQLERGSCDIVFDMRTTDLSSTGLLASAIVNTINSTNAIASFRTLTLASSSFPTSSGIPKGISMVRRLDWLLWTSILSRPSIVRKPSYGDYTCLNPEITDFDPLTMKPAAKIRYTSQRVWVTFKGSQMKGNGGQYHNLAANVIARQEYMGASFSWGDGYIDGCAQRTCGPGNLTNWVTVDVNHHIAYVIHQLQNEICPDAS